MRFGVVYRELLNVMQQIKILSYRKQSGFTHIGKAYQSHVRQQLQLQNYIPFLTLAAGLGKPGDLTGGGGVVAVAPAAPAALGDDEILAGGHVHDDLIGLGIPDHGASGHADDEVFAVFASAAAALAVVLLLVWALRRGGHDYRKVYAAYNELQKEQGLNLSRYKGKDVTRYTFAITNYKDYEGTVYANVLVYRNRVIGGDVCSADVSGFVHGFEG